MMVVIEKECPHCRKTFRFEDEIFLPWDFVDIYFANEHVRGCAPPSERDSK